MLNKPEEKAKWFAFSLDKKKGRKELKGGKS